MTPLRKSLCSALLLVLAGGATTAMAHQITCESENDQTESCNIRPGSDVRLVQQESNSPCIEGQSWGVGENESSIWVARGCRAVFDVESNDSYARRGDDDRNDYGDNDRWEHRRYAQAGHMRREARRSCIDEAASNYSLDRDDVSATGERPLGRGRFAVSLDTPDGPMTCTVDNDGDVQSIDRRY